MPLKVADLNDMQEHEKQELLEQLKNAMSDKKTKQVLAKEEELTQAASI